MLDLIDSAVGGWCLMIIGLMEYTAVILIYGPNRLLRNINEMGVRLHPAIQWFWKICWCGVGPLMLVIVLFWQLQDAKIGNESKNPWIQFIWVMLILAVVIPMPIGFVFALVRAKGKHADWKDALSSIFKPTQEWGPKVNGQ